MFLCGFARLSIVVCALMAQVEELAPDEVLGPGAAPLPAQGTGAAVTPEAPISVEEEVADEQLQQTIHDLLLKYPGVVTADVWVVNGVVELEGHVRDADARDRVTQFVRRVQGVRLVLNRMRTDEQVLSSWDFFWQRLGEYGRILRRYWLRALGGILIFLLSIVLAKAVSAGLNAVLAYGVERELLRSLIKSLIAVSVVIAGLLIALAFMGLTELVLSVAGIAGIVGLTLGFAFRDIGENLIASVFLGFRRPFQVGDLIEVAGNTGVVRSMNMRATVLMTFEGSHIRIPNGTVFKQVLVNRTSAGKIRTDFSLLVPFEAPTKKVMDALLDAIRGHPLTDDDPPSRVFIEDISPEGVRMHGFFWHSVELNPILLKGEILLRTKVALQKLNVAPPPPEFKVTVPFIAAETVHIQRRQEEESRKKEGAREEDEAMVSELEKDSAKNLSIVTAGVTTRDEENVEEGENMLQETAARPKS